MKKILFTIMLLLVALSSFASLRQTSYRWRNDNGNETAATWKAAQNTEFTLNSNSERFRLRMEFDNQSSGLGTGIINNKLEYSADGGLNWTLINNSATTNAFAFETSTFVTQGAATTTQITGGIGTYSAGKIISSATITTQTLNDNGRTEYEYVIKSTPNILPNTTYTFRFPDYDETPVFYPTLKTNCMTVELLSHQGDTGCAKTSLQLLATVNNPTNNQVRWYSVPVGGIPVFTGPVFNTPNLPNSTVYYVAGYDPTTHCETERVAVSATIYGGLDVNLGNDYSICLYSNENVTLDAGSFPNALSYLWNTGATTQSITINNTGLYYVDIIDTNLCHNKDSINISILPKPEVDLGPDRTICIGASQILDAGNPNQNYYWNNGAITRTLTIQQPGIYSVMVTNSDQCTGADTIAILPGGNLPSIDDLIPTNLGDQTFSFTATNPRYVISYKWNFGDGAIVTTTTPNSPTHTYLSEGSYPVILTITSTCGDVNDTVTVTILSSTGVNDVDKSDNLLKVYPNPTINDQLFIANESSLLINKIAIYNILGQEVSTYNTSSRNNKIDIILPSTLNSGMYTLRINTEKGVITKKINVVK